MNNHEKVQIRRIQALTGDRSFTLVFPKSIAQELGIIKGDFLKCHKDGTKLIVEKCILGEDEENGL
jgi:bifunctional DNA-binding transcriptional regulator/antitoxin component of YhaV-PrlF toxin-antitoxin module